MNRISESNKIAQEEITKKDVTKAYYGAKISIVWGISGANVAFIRNDADFTAENKSELRKMR